MSSSCLPYVYVSQKKLGHQGNDWLIHIASAMTAGMASTSLTNPVWVIKTRFMVNGLKIKGRASFDFMLILYYSSLKTKDLLIDTIAFLKHLSLLPKTKGLGVFIKD